MSILNFFRNKDVPDFPNFTNYKKPLEMGLWVLWVAKDDLGVRKLSSDEVSSVIIEILETSVDSLSITRAFSRAGKKIHPHKENNIVKYEIMREGKDHLKRVANLDLDNIIYFEPGKKYTSKRQLINTVLTELVGDLKIVDPYCSERTIDVLSNIKCNNIKIITKTAYLSSSQRDNLKRTLKDYYDEGNNLEIREYPNDDLHDRYIISEQNLILLGHSIKDLGAKESFALVLSKEYSKNICESLLELFNRRWKSSQPL